MIYHVRETVDASKSVLHVELQQPIPWCCDRLHLAFHLDFLRFGTQTYYNQDPFLNLYRCYPYPEYTVWHTMPITHCPFCGTAITAIIHQEVLHVSP